MVTLSGYSQVTTSGMNGKITGANNESLPGATIVAVHQPSGTQYATVSNSEGYFNIQGMRSGGPFNVEVSFVGYNKATYTDVNLSLGESFVLNVKLNESSIDVEEVIVVGIKPSEFSSDKMGAATNINAKSMELIPSLNRSLSDYTKLSTFATGSGSFVGREAYNTNVTVDGANFNNNFGLSGSSMPGVSGEPISMDAIEEIQVAVAPFDVTQSNFTGASINAVTKSGTNTFKGTAYTFYRDQDFNGKKIRDKELAVSESSKKVIGFSLGGPIIKNKLFFFVSGETENSSTPGNTLLANDTGRDLADPNVNALVKASDLQKFSSLLKSKYGYETGAYENWGGDVEKNNKILGKLDWNINDNHKLTVRYNYSESSNVSRPSGSGDARPSITPSGTGITGRHNRLGGMSFKNSQYYSTNTLHSVTGELNSRFNQLQNKLLVAYTKYNQPRQSDSQEFPFIDIMSGDATKGNVMMSAGYELFSYMNNVDNNTLIVTDNVTYMLNKHTLTAGMSYEHQYFANSYLRQGSGYYRFKDLISFENYVNGAGNGLPYSDNYDPINFAYTYPINGYTSPEGELSFGQLSAYGQDEWNALDNLKVTAGIRLDLPMYLDGAIDNPGLKGQKFRDGEEVDLSSWPEAKILWSPRLGFTWDIKGDKSLKVRGGTGVFTGRIPFVWFTNQPTNSGMLQYQLVINQADGATSKEQLSRIPFKPNAKDLLNDNAISDIFPKANVVRGKFAAIDKNFKLPQVWRTSLGFDLKLPLDMMLTMEGIYTKDLNAIYFDNINLAPAASTILDGGSARPYWSNSTSATKYINTTFSDVVIMRNTSKGDGYTLSAQLDLPRIYGFSGMVGYSRSMGKELTGKNGSDPFSAWQYRQILNSLNDPEMGNTLNNTPHRVIGSLNYSIEYGKYFGTTISIFYSGYQGNAYTFLYNGDMNKDGTSTHEQMFIPSTEADLLWKTPEDRDAYFVFAAQDPYLSKNPGKYAARNGAYTPWNSRFDIRLLQDFKMKFGNTSNKLQLSVDVVNFANLLNSSWGLNQSVVTNSPLKVVGRDATTGKLTVEMTKINNEYIKSSFQDPSSVAGTFGVQVGVRYIFN